MSVYFTVVRTLFCVENASSVSGCCMFAVLQEYLCCYLVVTFFIFQWLEKTTREVYLFGHKLCVVQFTILSFAC